MIQLQPWYYLKASSSPQSPFIIISIIFIWTFEFSLNYYFSLLFLPIWKIFYFKIQRVCNVVQTSVGFSVLFSSPVSVSDDRGPRCLNLSSAKSIFGVKTSYFVSFWKKKEQIIVFWVTVTPISRTQLTCTCLRIH